MNIMKKLAAGIDIGGTNTEFGLVDENGKVYAKSTLKMKDYPDLDDYIKTLYLTIERMYKSVSESENEPVELVGIGIGAPNANYYRGTIEYAKNLAWPDVVIPLKERMHMFYPNLPIIVTNDANAATIGEMVYGAAKGMKDFMMVTLGTGVGSGFVANGKMIYGYDSFAGELGHTIVKPGGRKCNCGRAGCLETYASATGIVRTIYKMMADEIDESNLRRVAYNDMQSVKITEAALMGDTLAIKAFEYTGEMLGLAIANAVAITSPEAVFLFGGLAKAGKYIFDPTKRSMEANLLFTFQNRVKLLPSDLGEEAAILGASALIWDELGVTAE
jgi:glucokinase